jgi:hypothetical protein
MRKAMATLGMRDVSDGGMLQLVMSATGPGSLWPTPASGGQVTEAQRLTPPHTIGLGSWLSTSGCGSAPRKADAALPRSGRGPTHVPGGAWMGADWRGARALATCTVH